MPTITDRNLLMIEPAVFTTASTAALRLLTATNAQITGTTLTIETEDFESHNIGAGHVAVANGVALEVIERASATELEVSLPRASVADASIAPGDGASLTVEVLTFAGLIHRVRAAALMSLGIEPHDPNQPLDEAAILNPESLARFIALRTIHYAFAAAAAAVPTSLALAQRASVYARQASVAFAQAAAVIDVDGDGQGDGSRRLGVVTLRRT